MERTDRVVLAHVPSFGLGRLTVLPAVHQLQRDDGASEILQHRVMQVLVALARADGAIVTRDELTMSCWDGRVVGEDAINRVLSRLRSVAAGIGAGSFRIETVTRVGYRLLLEGDAAESVGPSAPLVGRRAMLAGGGVAALAALGGLGWWFGLVGDGETLLPDDIEPLMAQARIALSQDTREGHNQAIGLYRRVVALAPEHADGWGALGSAYALTALYRAADECDALRVRARAAARRALALDPENGLGQLAMAISIPARGNWLGMERALRHAVARHPDNDLLLFAHASVLMSVGRNLEALPLAERMAQVAPATPDIYSFRVRLLSATNRLEEADRLLDEASSIYPTHFAIWFARFYLLLFSGRAGAAVALAQDRYHLPTGIPATEVDAVLAAARAVHSRDTGEIDRAMAFHSARARTGAGYAVIAIQFACAVGRIDDAVALANAYYFGRGFVIPEIRFTREQGLYSPQRDRPTAFLFWPPLQTMRADPRFDSLITQLGLKRYWAEAGTRPDYQRT